MFFGSNLCGQTVILDPLLTCHTPEWLWLSTAIRAVDHAVEGILNPDSNPMIVGQALHALSLFFQNLRRTKKVPEDLAARLACQQAVWLSTAGLGRVSMGASHGIGYILGTVGGVPHGHTSCVMLPTILTWNAPATKEKQVMMARAMGQPGVSPATQLSQLLGDLDLPQSLQDVGIEKGQLGEIAKLAAQHPVVRANPRPITSVAETTEILDLAWS